MATGKRQDPAPAGALRRWRALMVLAAVLGLVQLGLLTYLWATPAPEPRLPPSLQAPPARAHPQTPAPAAPTALTKQRGVAALDALLAQRVERAAHEAGRDPAALLPHDELRQAALEAASFDSQAWQVLADAYDGAFEALGIVAPSTAPPDQARDHQ